MRIKLSEEAAAEMIDAAAWYDSHEAGLGIKFLGACDLAFEQISRTPEVHLQVGKGFRRYLIHQFPYVVYYEINNDLLIIVGVIHGARKPEVWKQRLGLS